MNHPQLEKGMKLVPCAVIFDDKHPRNGWLFIPSGENTWVSYTRLDFNSMLYIALWLNEFGPKPMEAENEYK